MNRTTGSRRAANGEAWRRHSRGAAPFLAAIIAACAGASSSGEDSPAAAATASDVRITLERGACFGRCPMYRVELDGSGKVVYEGRHFVRDSGRREDTIPATDVRALAQELERAGYFAFDDRYPPDATDHATVTTSLTLGGKAKRVEHNLGSSSAPPVLENFYKRIDEVARTAKWIGEPQSGPPLKGRTSEPASSVTPSITPPEEAGRPGPR